MNFIANTIRFMNTKTLYKITLLYLLHPNKYYANIINMSNATTLTDTQANDDASQSVKSDECLQNALKTIGLNKADVKANELTLGKPMYAMMLADRINDYTASNHGRLTTATLVQLIISVVKSNMIRCDADISAFIELLDIYNETGWHHYMLETPLIMVLNALKSGEHDIVLSLLNDYDYHAMDDRVASLIQASGYPYSSDGYKSLKEAVLIAPYIPGNTPYILNERHIGTMYYNDMLTIARYCKHESINSLASRITISEYDKALLAANDKKLPNNTGMTDFEMHLYNNTFDGFLAPLYLKVLHSDASDDIMALTALIMDSFEKIEYSTIDYSNINSYSNKRIYNYKNNVSMRLFLGYSHDVMNGYPVEYAYEHYLGLLA